ncbi:MAG: hypothetical protein LBO72_03955 [Helicobacteraceae bacterium]|jgi:hypothetical protein|nr:hypothetical protein [Helicobacteraceae bacterium]
MFKTGITTIEDLRDKSKWNTWLLKRSRNVAITLYNETLNSPELSEKVLREFTDDRGVYKRTAADRFAAFDIEALKIIELNFAQNEQLAVSDVAVSDGRTALDFFQKLDKIRKIRVYDASDYLCVVNAYEKDGVTAVAGNNKIIQIVWKKCVLSKKRKTSFIVFALNVVNYMLYYFLTPKAKRAIEEGKKTEIKLFCPSALLKSKQDDRFSLFEHNILEPFISRYHIIRAMNILNFSYFNVAQFETIIDNFYASLSDGGLLITGSNQDAGSIVNGAIYKKTKNGFELIYESGEGSATKGLIENYAAKSAITKGD